MQARRLRYFQLADPVRCCCFIALELALVIGVAPTRAAAPSTDEHPVALPPFIVEEPSKGPPWRYTEAMGYEILSRCNDTATRRVVEAHYRLHQLLGEILPPQLQVVMSVPRTLILYDEELQPAASQEVIARMLRNTPAPAEETAPFMGSVRGLRVPAVTRRYSFLPNLRLWDRDSMAIFMIVRRDDFNTERLSLTHDYVSFLVKARVPTLPPWFTYGFLATHQQIEYSDVRLTLGPLEWISEKHTDALKKNPKLAPSVLPLDDFFGNKLPARDPTAAFEPVKAWQAQAQLFVRWGLDPGGGVRREAFWKFTERVVIEGASEKLFQECFELSYAEAQAQLAAFLNTAVRRTVYFHPARFVSLPRLALRNASDAQIARIKGDWERLEINYVKALSPDLVPKYLEQARRTLKRAYDRGERDPQLLAVLGLCEVDGGNDAAAREYFESAINIGSIRPRANYELARLRFVEASANPAGKDGRLSVSQTAAVLTPLFAARAENPPLPEVYELIAEVWLRTSVPPTRAHLAVLDEGVRLFPRRAELVLRSAELNLRHGFRDEAAALIDVSARLADDEATRERVVALQQMLQK